MDFTTQIETISEDQLDSLFNSSSSSNEPAKVDTPIQENKIDPTPKVIDTNLIPEIDLDDLEEPIKEEAKTEEKKEEVKSEEKVEEPKKEDTPAKKEDESVDSTQVNSILKNTVDYLIEKGIYKDFEGRDKLEINEDVYAELAVKQAEANVEELFNELVDSTGDYGKAIIEHIKNGGNPDEIIDLFKEQKQVENLDVSDPKNAVSLIQKYYSEVVGWSKAKVDKYLTTLQASENGVEDEVKEVQDKFDELYSKQLADIRRHQADQQANQKRLQQEYVSKLTTTIDQSKLYTDKDKKLIKEGVLKYNKKLPNGSPTNEFYLKLSEIQQNPEEYAQLVYWVLDRTGYDNKVKVVEDNKVVEKTWKFIKGNGAVNKKGSQPDPIPEKKSSKIDFSVLLKK